MSKPKFWRARWGAASKGIRTQLEVRRHPSELLLPAARILLQWDIPPGKGNLVPILLPGNDFFLSPSSITTKVGSIERQPSRSCSDYLRKGFRVRLDFGGDLKTGDISDIVACAFLQCLRFWKDDLLVARLRPWSAFPADCLLLGRLSAMWLTSGSQCMKEYKTVDPFVWLSSADDKPLPLEVQMLCMGCARGRPSPSCNPNNSIHMLNSRFLPLDVLDDESANVLLWHLLQRLSESTKIKLLSDDRCKKWHRS